MTAPGKKKLVAAIAWARKWAYAKRRVTDEDGCVWPARATEEMLHVRALLRAALRSPDDSDPTCESCGRGIPDDAKGYTVDPEGVYLCAKCSVLCALSPRRPKRRKK